MYGIIFTTIAKNFRGEIVSVSAVTNSFDYYTDADYAYDKFVNEDTPNGIEHFATKLYRD